MGAMFRFFFSTLVMGLITLAPVNAATVTYVVSATVTTGHGLGHEALLGQTISVAFTVDPDALNEGPNAAIGTYLVSIPVVSTAVFNTGATSMTSSYINIVDNLAPGRDALVFAASSDSPAGVLSIRSVGFNLETRQNLNAISSTSLFLLTPPNISLFEFENSFLMTIRDRREEEQKDLSLWGYVSAISTAGTVSVDEAAQTWLLALLGVGGLAMMRKKLGSRR